MDKHNTFIEKMNKECTDKKQKYQSVYIKNN